MSLVKELDYCFIINELSKNICVLFNNDVVDEACR